ncbi:Rieske (2Fe-2S) protein [Capnocytophaga canimorsus]|uniref:hypothetical protein n=1 Tax=Capnocytophaga canimorsus TaxID=28188 RepID=UPI000F509A3B|nr:hypothetical protein [Capnocytophaga canimorsus]MDT9500175.1 hypothetical protein [Capnocytophaga canimorsus]
MKKIFLFFSLLLVCCSKPQSERNPYLPEVRFSFSINMNLPAYNQLKNPLIPIYIGNAGVGIQGVYVMNTGGNNYVAWEASCPNHQVKSCEKMQLKDGFYVVCPCDDNLYSLVNGNIVKQGENAQKPYPLLNYKVVASGTTLNVYN